MKELPQETASNSSATARLSYPRGERERTGMKWLLEKRNCLVIKQGEGFCRD